MISYVESPNELETMHNQLLALFMRASPILASMVKNKDEDYSRRLAEYFDSSANAHWAVLFPKSRKIVKEPSVAESAEFKKISSGLSALSRQVQALNSKVSTSNHQAPIAAAAPSYAAAASKASPKPTETPKTPLPKPTTVVRPRLVIRVASDCTFTLQQPSEILRTINEGLEKLGHKARLSAAHRTTKGNLVVTAAPDVSPEELSATSTAISSIIAPFSTHPVLVHRDVKWSKLIVHNVWTGKTRYEPAHSSDEIHRELIAHNPFYRELKITQKPSWVKDPAAFKEHARSSLSFAFEDPDAKIAHSILRIFKVVYLFGDRSPLRGWRTLKIQRLIETTANTSPATGANKTKRKTGKLKISPTAASPSASPLPPKPTPTQFPTRPKNPPKASTTEVEVARLERFLDRAVGRSSKVPVKLPADINTQDIEMHNEERESDDEYITEEEYLEDDGPRTSRHVVFS
jgi:hypothetical protein